MARTVAQIQADLDAHYAARLASLNGDYSLDTGQGRQSVTRRSLTEINKSIAVLEDEMEEATSLGLNSVVVRR